jgi:DNA polymerase IV
VNRIGRTRRIGCLLVGEAPPLTSEALWEALGAHSPGVERDEGAGRFYLDVGNVTPRYGDEAGWCRAVLGEAHALGLAKARLGVAGNKFAAEIAAQMAPAESGYLVNDVADARFLAPLLLEALPLSNDARRRLRLLGIETMGRLAALPSHAIAEQFGAESLSAWRWARGQDERPVLGQRCQTYAASHLFEVPETHHQGLVEAAAHLAERALADLPVDRRAWALRRVSLTARTDEGQELAHSAWLGESPGPETLRALLTRMVPRLGGEGEGIAELTVSLWGLEPAPGRQLSLLEAYESDPRWRQVARLMQLKYPEGLVRPVLADPQAPILTERYTLQAWRP